MHKLKSTVKVLTVLLEKVVKMARVHVIDSVFKSIHRNGNYVSNGVYTIMKNGNLIKDFVLFGKPEGKLQAARGQARIPDIDAIHELTEQAKKAGWAYKGDEKTI